MTDISVVINLHRESRLLHASVRSALDACATAEHEGAKTEIVLVFDNPDDETRVYANENPLTAKLARTVIDAGDLGLARNAGTNLAKGQYIAFLDGDDLFSGNWLAGAWRLARQAEASRRIVWHPETNLVFGGVKPHYFPHLDMDDPAFEMDWFRVGNYWTALTFAERSLFLEFPYGASNFSAGVGYEDWSWNCQTIAAGIKHKIVPGSLHFIRRKPGGSLLQETKARNALPDWDKLFAPGSIRGR